ncbi:MAG: epoxide hydrolase [Chloroflexota bacterium]|nr:epoxide hydrolase [Chloroflexota bacterium]
MSIQPFTIAISQATLDDLRERLARTRWPDEAEHAGWNYGTNLDYLKELVDYWQHSYNWRTQEAKLNQFAQFRAEIDGSRLHFLHVRGKGPHPTPLLLIHGWPDSFYRFHKIISLLTDPESVGGNPLDSFDVIVPSLPGFGFSDRPHFPGGMKSLRAASLLSTLMTEVLGYKRYAVGGGDIGSRVTRLLALAHPEQVLGIHLTDIGFPREIAFPPDVPNPSPAEGRFLGSVGMWFFQEGAYAALQTTKPQTISYALSDSPVGVAGWIVEKFRAWSDCDGEIEKSYTKDELLTNLMIYWATGTISSSVRLYHEDGLQSAPQLSVGQYIEVPAGVATFPKDLTYPPRELGERFLRVARWTEMPRGGHFAALEVPELLAEDIRAFLLPLRSQETERENRSEKSS